VTGIRDGRGWRPASGLCQFAVNGHLLGIHPGDSLQLFGQLARQAPPLNPGEFDFAANSRAERQLARIRSTAPECVVHRAAGNSWTPSYWLDNLRVRTKQLVGTMVGPQRAGLAAAILLGAREGLPYEETEPYLQTGTVHVLVVSGMNVAILAAGLLWLMQFGWLPRRIGLGVIIAVVVCYALLAEAQPPVVRAAVVGVLFCLAAWSGRRGVAFNTLFTAAILVLAINPNDLFRVGPQLSFLAVAVLVWVTGWRWWPQTQVLDPLDKLVESARPWHEKVARWSARGTIWLLLISVAIWLTALPLVLSQFHIASPIAVFISPIVSLIVFVAMWSGFLMIVIGSVIPAIGAICGTICNASLSWLEQIVAWADAVPYGHFWAPGPAWWWVAVFYCGLLLVMVWGKIFAARRWQVAALAAWIMVGLVPPLARSLMRNGLDCSFVAVGHGACVVMETADGKTLLYDAGAIGSPEYATQSIASYLWHRGIMRIDGIVISHADIDHYNAVPGLLERFRIGTVYVSPVMFSDIGDPRTAGGTKVLRDAIDRAGVPIREIFSGDRLQVASDVSLRVLHPPERGVLGSDNANSITLAVEHAGRRMLLPGDLESPGIDDLMAEEPYNCDILLAPHHGSRRSDPPGFAAWSTPEWVVISGGQRDDIRPVVQTYSRAGANVLATNELGSIAFNLAAGEHLGVNTHRAPVSLGKPPVGQP
jgi:competence protein ComEC